MKQCSLDGSTGLVDELIIVHGSNRKMAPYPEELDVFSVPHSRMKQLVEGYSNKVSCTDFSNHDATAALLRSLYSTFKEFKCHETIENEFIMQQLRSRLRDLEVNEHESVVCNCHSDNRLSEMLRLVRAGYSYNKKSSLERIRYGRRLEAALEDFTKTFLPHMEEEEEIFQPMLVKYFAYEELKSLKELVIEQHEKLKPVDSEEDDECEKFRHEEDCHSKSGKNAKHNKEKQATESPFETLPPEITSKIFSYLRPTDLGCCSSVCRSWHSLIHQPALWRCLLPTQWARGDWNSLEVDYFPPEDGYGGRKCGGRRCYECHVLDEDADIDESCATEDEIEDVFCKWKIVKKERQILKGICMHVLPLAGSGVHHLSFAGSASLEGQWLSAFLQKCPNLLHLDLSYSNINDGMIQSLTPGFRFNEHSERDACCHHLIHLDLSGCGSITDVGLVNLVTYLLLPSVALLSMTMECQLESLNLSGCSHLTDQSLRFLSCVSGSLRQLDLSGCWMLTGSALSSFVDTCPKLVPELLSYCDHIVDGPCQDLASGCQNLGSRIRSCCCSAE